MTKEQKQERERTVREVEPLLQRFAEELEDIADYSDEHAVGWTITAIETVRDLRVITRTLRHALEDAADALEAEAGSDGVEGRA